MKIDPNGKMPPRGIMTNGSMNHFFSGIGLKRKQVNGITRFEKMKTAVGIPFTQTSGFSDLCAKRHLRETT
jgi:hypothetical protein